MYTNENGQVVYATTVSSQPQAIPSISQPTAVVTGSGNITAQQPTVVSQTTTQPTATKTPAKGRKRKSAAQTAAAANAAAAHTIAVNKGNKENQIIAETSTVDEMSCAPDDEDINTPYPCPQCNKTVKGKVMLQAHQYQEHYDNPEFANLELGDKHACRVCLKLFTRNSDVKAHILRVHCGDRRYPCTMCGKRFKESTHLRKHLYTHTGK